MALENGKWRVVRGDCLWNIAKSVYNNPYKWTEIANANGISQKTALIYPGQLLTLPGISSGSQSSGGSSTPPPTPTQKPRIDWFALTAGSEREMQAVWSYNADYFHIRWEQWDSNNHLWMISEEKNKDCSGGAQKASIGTLNDTEGWNVCRFSVRPVDKEGNPLANTTWEYKEYDFRNNPPLLPPSPTFSIDTNNVLTVTLENIDEKINGKNIEIAIYQDDVTKYKTATVPINFETRFAKYTCNVDPGHYYKVRCRAVRGNIYGGWTDYTSNDQSVPIAPSEIITLRPQVISEQMSKKYGVFAEWTEVKSATKYDVQWTTNIELFESGDVSSKTTEEGKGPRLLISDIEVGHEYFFRVRSVNEKGASQNWSPIKSVIIGSKPIAPTTWSNTTSAIIGEDLNLYWVHNSTDNSIETYARLHFTIVDSLNPNREPMEYTKVIPNDKPEEDKNKTSVYTINTNDEEWALLDAGFIIKWKAQTAGVGSEYSDWSVEREVNVYAKPELELDITNQNGESISEINNFPFHFSVLAKPSTQVPISYYLEVVANEKYETVDNVGNVITVNPGDKVYQKYYDPDTNPWRFIAVMSPSNIDLENDVSYTVNCTVSMNSGLTAISSQSFNVYFNDMFYDVAADILINEETLEANIHPYCCEFEEESGLTTKKLVENCTLSVYRREYDGTFTEIATGVNNEEGLYVTDPHPSLDYARYRVVAKTNDTGAISYSDIPAVKVGEPSFVIQWAEKWSAFETGENGEGSVEPSWSGSMIRIPYNIDFSENNGVDVSLVEYAGRKHPVSYYGTQLGSSSSGSAEIPADDKETLYNIRRLSRWTGNVYFREPSGVGYWANITVSYNKTHNKVTIPVSFTIKRVEGGM